MRKVRCFCTILSPMIIQTIQTEKITVGSTTLLGIVGAALSEMQEGSILVITSKIVSICEGRVVKSAPKISVSSSGKKHNF